MKVRLDIFEGPLDLLLHLIKKNEVDIYDIPIASITEQYIEYLEMMKEMNLEFAGEFLVMAATLVQIKSRLLLPIDETIVEDESGVDPREELIRRLLEYQRYKEAAQELFGKDVLGRDVFTRGVAYATDELEEGVGFSNCTVFDLMEALKVVLERAPKERALELTIERFKIADKINHVLERLGREKSATFTGLFEQGAVRGEIIVTFLAILELAKMQLIRIHQSDDSIIRVYLSEAQDSADETTTEAG